MTTEQRQAALVTGLADKLLADAKAAVDRHGASDPLAIPLVATAFGYVIAEISLKMHPDFAVMVGAAAAKACMGTGK